jgi:effector-binding domain-containing protein
MIEMERHMPYLEVIVKPVPPVRALTIQLHLPEEDQKEHLLAFGDELEQAIAQYQIRMNGLVIENRYSEEFRLDFDDVEIVLPVDENAPEVVPLETMGELRLKTVPGMAMAATYIHRGIEHLSEGFPVLQRWIVDNGYRLCGTYRALNHRGPLEHAEYEDWIVEFQHEVAFVDESP